MRSGPIGPAPASPLTDSNRRPLPYHGSALPTELRGRSPTRLAEQRAPRPACRLRSVTPVPTSATYRTRLVERRDADALRAIYNVEVLESTVTFDLVPRSLAEQLAWIDEHSGGHPAIVAVDDDDEVVRLRVAARRTGPGPRTRRRSRTPSTCAATSGARVSAGCCSPTSSTLARDHGFHSVIGRIVGDHDASIALHAACGFEQVGREREVGRKFNRWLDVVLMQDVVDAPCLVPRATGAARSIAERRAGAAQIASAASRAASLRKSRWAGLDSNQRSGNAMGLQPIPFGHSGTDPDLI